MSLTVFKQKYQTLQTRLEVDFLADMPVDILMKNRSDGVDALLVELWQVFELDKSLCLVAVGGYGRSELCLFSDIDLLILLPEKTHQTHKKDIANFLSFLWDIGLEVGHSTRDMADCVAAIEDLSVVTNMLEARYLTGDKSLVKSMQGVIENSSWQSQSFLVAKQKELENRYKLFAGTAYGVEPNIKESPGGLRDIQTLLWVTKWHWGLADLSALYGQNFLNDNEYHTLEKQQNLLWHLRFGLHIVAGRREDKIGFQVQKKLADKLKFIDGYKMAVEQMMHQYYQAVRDISQINDVLMQSLEKMILHTQRLNARFSIREGYLRTNNKDLFQKQPSALLEVFLLCAQHNYIKGIDAFVLRAIFDNLPKIDQKFRDNPEHAKIFMDILRTKQGVNLAVHLMSRYGVLSAYIPEFGKISGLMQYDLFHKFTVDQHTLFVVRNLRRFFIPDHAKEFALCHKIATNLDKPELLILAGLFHDIAKGRGGDHATLGAVDARNFANKMGLSQYDGELVAWLVEQHLLMSSVAQKQDIANPEVVLNFAKNIGVERNLNYLYLLTVADIRATNKELWNDWKDTLLKQLYYATNDLLRQGLEQSRTQKEVVIQARESIIYQLIRQGEPAQNIEQWQQNMPDEYFIRYTPEDAIWHYRLSSQASGQDKIIAFSNSQQGKQDIFIHTQDQKCIFLSMIIALERLSLPVVEAKVVSSQDNKTFNTLSVISPVDKMLDLDRIKQALITQLDTPKHSKVQLSDRSRQHKHFNSHTQVSITQIVEKYSVLEVKTLDKKCVLSTIMCCLCELNLLLLNARVATYGERVEDVFHIQNQHQKPLNKTQKLQLKKQLITLL